MNTIVIDNAVNDSTSALVSQGLDMCRRMMHHTTFLIVSRKGSLKVRGLSSYDGGLY